MYIRISIVKVNVTLVAIKLNEVSKTVKNVQKSQPYVTQFFLIASRPHQVEDIVFSVIYSCNSLEIIPK